MQDKEYNGYKIPRELFGCVNDNGTVDERSVEEGRQRFLDVLKKVGIKVEIPSYVVGTSVITYNVLIFEKLSIRKMLSLQSAISLGLNAHAMCYLNDDDVFCIEVPRKDREVVELGEMIEKCSDNLNSDALPIIFGKSTQNEIISYNLSKLADLFIVGDSGSGKSCFLNSVITTLICNHSPNDLKLVLIDPKGVEFSVYSDLPHLLSAPVSNPADVIDTMKGVIDEMERRYAMFAATKEDGLNAFNIDDYNKQAEDGQKLPRIVVVIDELEDLMYSNKNDISNLIMWLTAKGRAAGVSLIASAQRISGRKIDKSLLANFHARIAFRTSQADSQILLECKDGENLLGSGDFLYRSPFTNAIGRAQSPYISMSGVKNVVAYIKEHN